MSCGGLALLTPLVRVLVEVIDPAGVERGGAPLDAVNLVALLKEELSQVTAVLPGDAGDQGGFGRGCGLRWGNSRRKTPERSLLGALGGVGALAVGGQPGGG